MDPLSCRNDAAVLNRFLASWSGCDGGNPKAPLWICGIEHGGECEPDTPLDEEQQPNAWDDAFKTNHPKFRTWQYHQKVAKMMVAIDGLRGQPQEGGLMDYRTYMEKRLYTRGGDTFKLNLFPFSSPSTASPKWDSAYAHRLGMTRNEYGELCRKDRFAFFARQRREFDPKVLLGTGKMYRDDFARAFGFSNTSPASFFIERRECWRYKDQGSTLIVTPFFGGRYGMNSNHLLEKLAEEVAFILYPRAVV